MSNVSDDVIAYEDVASTLQYQLDELISKYEENLAIKMASECRRYNLDYCAQDLYSVPSEYAKLRENAILDLVEAELKVLFANR